MNKTQIKVCFYRAYLGWSIETCVSKLRIYRISSYLKKIKILCAKMSWVNKALRIKKWVPNFIQKIQKIFCRTYCQFPMTDNVKKKHIAKDAKARNGLLTDIFF